MKKSIKRLQISNGLELLMKFVKRNMKIDMSTTVSHQESLQLV